MANTPGILEKIERIIDLHPNIINMIINGYSVIDFACENSASSSVDIVKLLIRKGSDIRRVVKGHGNLLTRTMKHLKSGTVSEDIAILLIDLGLNVNEYEDHGRLESGYNPLLYAVVSNSERMVQILLEHGANADSKIYTETCYDDYTTTSALECALMRKKPNEVIINLLLDKGHEYIDDTKMQHMLRVPNLSQNTKSKLLARHSGRSLKYSADI